MKLASLIKEQIDVYDFLKQNRGQIELDHGPRTYRYTRKHRRKMWYNA